MSPETDTDHVDGAQRGSVFLKRSSHMFCYTAQSIQTQQKWFQLRVRYISYLHFFNKSCEVVGCLVCVIHRLKVIHIGGSVVPVHYDDVHVFPDQQHLHDVVQPYRWRSRGPVPVNNEGCWSGGVKLGVGGQVCVGHECTTGDIIPGVQQQPNLEAGSNDRMAEIQICEFITPLSWE